MSPTPQGSRQTQTPPPAPPLPGGQAPPPGPAQGDSESPASPPSWGPQTGGQTHTEHPQPGVKSPWSAGCGGGAPPPLPRVSALQVPPLAELLAHDRHHFKSKGMSPFCPKLSFKLLLLNILCFSPKLRIPSHHSWSEVGHRGKTAASKEHACHLVAVWGGAAAGEGTGAGGAATQTEALPARRASSAGQTLQGRPTTHLAPPRGLGAPLAARPPLASLSCAPRKRTPRLGDWACKEGPWRPGRPPHRGWKLEPLKPSLSARGPGKARAQDEGRGVPSLPRAQGKL